MCFSPGVCTPCVKHTCRSVGLDVLAPSDLPTSVCKLSWLVTLSRAHKSQVEGYQWAERDYPVGVRRQGLCEVRQPFRLVWAFIECSLIMCFALVGFCHLSLFFSTSRTSRTNRTRNTLPASSHNLGMLVQSMSSHFLSDQDGSSCSSSCAPTSG